MPKLRMIAMIGALASVGALGFVGPAPDAEPITAPVDGTAEAAEPAGALSVAALDGAAGEVAEAPVDEAEEVVVEPALESFTGSASYYADKFEGRTTASGVPFRQAKLWAAHKTLPFGTRLRVTNLTNGEQVEVEVVDRGPYARGRVLDLSRTAAKHLDFIRSGHTRVKIEVLEKP